MSYTAQQVYNRAILRSSLNNANLFSTTDALMSMSYYEAQAMNIAAVTNPDYFGTEGYTQTRANYTDAWTLSASPGNVGIVTKVVISALSGTVADVAVGDKVSIINIHDPQHGAIPRCYIRNGKIHAYGTDLGTTDNDMVTQLKVYYTAIPTSLQSISEIMTVPDTWINLVVTPLAAEMALADQRGEDYDRLMQEYNRDVELFTLYMKAFNYTADQGFGFRSIGGP